MTNNSVLNLPWKYFPHTKHAYTLMWDKDTEHNFSKSKSRTDLKQKIYQYKPVLLKSCKYKLCFSFITTIFFPF